MHNNQKKRQTLLKALYQAREKDPDQGWLYLRDLDQLVESPGFALAILDELGHIDHQVTKCRITAQGALAYEAADS